MWKNIYVCTDVPSVLNHRGDTCTTVAILCDSGISPFTTQINPKKKYDFILRLWQEPATHPNVIFVANARHILIVCH